MGSTLGDLLAYSNPGQRDMALIIPTLSLFLSLSIALSLFYVSLPALPPTADLAELRLKKKTPCPYRFQNVRNSGSDNRTKCVSDKKEILSPPQTWPSIASSWRACQTSF